MITRCKVPPKYGSSIYSMKGFVLLHVCTMAVPSNVELVALLPQPEKGRTGRASAPSNIALVKYWGKEEGQRQIPLNESLSLTLGDLRTETTVTLVRTSDAIEDDRGARLLAELCPWDGWTFTYSTHNNFPTGCGIASSASGFAALVGAVADCLDLKRLLTPSGLEAWIKHWSRLGSGSAIRSIDGGWVSWSGTEATRVKGPQMKSLVMVFDGMPKKTGSSDGHRLAPTSILQPIRRELASSNHTILLRALANSDWKTIIAVTEAEFVHMHAVMLTGTPPLSYMNTQCVKFCSEFMAWRNASNLRATVTVDAGSNPHVLFDPRDMIMVRAFCARFDYAQIIHNHSSETGLLIGDDTAVPPPRSEWKRSIVVVSGKRYAGKSWFCDHLPLPHVTISTAIKRSYAQDVDIDADILCTHREIKEAHREAMVEFMEDRRRTDPAVWIRRAWEDAVKKNPFNTTMVVTDARRTTDLEYLRHQGRVFHVRIECPPSVRQERGWNRSTVDDLESECGLDEVVPDLVYQSESPISPVLETITEWADAGSPSPGRGFGKLILFGEHFVLYNEPAIVAALKVSTDCRVMWNGNSATISDNRPAVTGYKDKKGGELIESTALIFHELGIDPKGWDVVFDGDLTCTSGVGSSAANCVALARALSRFGSMSNERINLLAYRGESISHGTPSGVDNAASTYGGIIRYQRRDDNWIIDPITPPKPLFFVYASTGITASTSSVLRDVAKRREEDPDGFSTLLSRYRQLLQRGGDALLDGNLADVGTAMNDNHDLLRDLGVSCTELDHLVMIADRAGALGAKMTGTGRGGLIVALASDLSSQRAIADALRDSSATDVWVATL